MNSNKAKAIRKIVYGGNASNLAGRTYGSIAMEANDRSGKAITKQVIISGGQRMISRAMKKQATNNSKR